MPSARPLPRWWSLTSFVAGARIHEGYNGPLLMNIRFVIPMLIAAAASVSMLACSGRAPASQYSQKLVIIGFDGMDPDLVRQWIDAGKLPTFKKLIEQGGLYPLTTTHSPESPTAWASFATGVNAGKHNIYDFLVRDTNTYFPDLGMVTREPPRFLLNYIPVSRPTIARSEERRVGKECRSRRSAAQVKKTEHDSA